MFLDILISFTLILIIYQDFKERSVYTVIFLVALVLVITKAVVIINISEFLLYFGSNILILLIILSFVTLYFSLKKKKIVNITKNEMAWGDILFYIILCACFSTVNFIIFYILSLFITLLIILLISLTGNDMRKSIPLAGILSAIFLLINTFSVFFNFNLYTDLNIMNYLVYG